MSVCWQVISYYCSSAVSFFLLFFQLSLCLTRLDKHNDLHVRNTDLHGNTALGKSSKEMLLGLPAVVPGPSCCSRAPLGETDDPVTCSPVARPVLSVMHSFSFCPGAALHSSPVGLSTALHCAPGGTPGQFARSIAPHKLPRAVFRTHPHRASCWTRYSKESSCRSKFNAFSAPSISSTGRGRRPVSHDLAGLHSLLLR